jgi:hypothetical protein
MPIRTRDHHHHHQRHHRRRVSDVWVNGNALLEQRRLLTLEEKASAQEWSLKAIQARNSMDKRKD